MKIKGLRSYFREKWLPKALTIGMTEEQFWETNPRKMKPYSEAFKQRQMIADTNNWTLGLYIKSAFVAAMDKRGKYPDKPYLQDVEDKRIITEELNESEQEIARRKMMLSMGIPKALLDEMGS